jgi:hypothetical protein
LSAVRTGRALLLLVLMCRWELHFAEQCTLPARMNLAYGSSIPRTLVMDYASHTLRVRVLLLRRVASGRSDVY